ncbi:DNA polymerase III subunit gamma/tau [Actinobacillus delphinicola]|uniref:DNA polymerase III subunit gamma/tau n=1 Tax=Actinobacillus delphinicola TaxID=51161 RepID=A0A448TS80_9PAST|nr:DNA polymerase III subunit gamma/tau [Actinobacillus delphinicola]VEJ08693.1 DNA polymerase III subunits gamma and tau [Actinobacillus delphinicola]
MSYQVLARKYRPKTFSEVVGQKHVLTALSNGLKDNRLHHAYLFSGTRGVGKTSIARLFAKGLNCENGVTAEPCGHCENCVAIENGHFIDLIEIDAASRTKVEDTRELLDNVQYKPTQGRYKVYLIDEVHMLSRHSFNALLKTLEEPPEYVKFLLATTDPQKLPITILSRCMQFNLKALQPDEISQHLQHVLTAEEIPYEVLALDDLAIAAQGSIRDSLSLTDQAIAIGDGKVTHAIVKDMLGLLDDNQPLAIISALQAGNGEDLMHAIQEASNNGVDWLALISAVIEHLHKIAILQFLPTTAEESQRIAFLAKNIAPQDVQFFYQILLQGKDEIKNATNQRMAVEMLFLRALAFHPKFSQVDFYENIQFNHIPQTQQATPVQQVAPVQAPLSKPRQVASPAETTVSRPSHTKTNTVTENPLSSLQMMNRLNQLASEQKKKPQPHSNSVSKQATTELSAFRRSLNEAQNSAIQPRTSTSVPNKPSTMVPQYQQETVEVEKPIQAEDYRWQWINPEMAEDLSGTTKLSDIKQALARRITPALQKRVIQEVTQRDNWANIIEEMGIQGFIKEMALSTAKVAENDENIQLIIRPEKSYLKEKYFTALQQAVRDFYKKDISLTVTESSDAQWVTPSEYRTKIYDELCEQARQNLHNDTKLATLLSEFDATLITDSICPV